MVPNASIVARVTVAADQKRKRYCDNQGAAGAQATEELCQSLTIVRNVLQHVERSNNVERFVGEG